MNYPTIKEVEEASRNRLLKWTRFLPSPGQNAIGKPESWFDNESFEIVMEREARIMDRILERQKETGGITPELSKAVGWKG